MTLTSIIGGKHQLTLGDEQIELSPITLDIEAAFERNLLNKTKKSLTAMRDLVNDEEYTKLLKSVADSYALGRYKLLGKQGLEAIQTVDGLLILLSLISGRSEAQCLQLLKSYGAELGQAIATVLSESVGAVTSG